MNNRQSIRDIHSLVPIRERGDDHLLLPIRMYIYPKDIDSLVPIEERGDDRFLLRLHMYQNSNDTR